jgi:hypothetical protein
MWYTNQMLLKPTTDYNKQIYSQAFTNCNNKFYRKQQNFTYASAFRTYSKKLMVTLKFYQHIIHCNFQVCYLLWNLPIQHVTINCYVNCHTSTVYVNNNAKIKEAQFTMSYWINAFSVLYLKGPVCCFLKSLSITVCIKKWCLVRRLR